MEQTQQDSYSDYIDEVVDTFSLSSKSSSILFNLKINNDDININVSIVEQSGDKKELPRVSYKNDEKFYDDFIKKVVSKVYNSTNVVVSDVVNLDGDEYFAFRMITENYDLFVIDGLEKGKAYELLDSLKKDDNNGIQLIKNDNGTGDILLFFIMISVLVVSLISVMVFLG